MKILYSITLVLAMVALVHSKNYDISWTQNNVSQSFTIESGDQITFLSDPQDAHDVKSSSVPSGAVKIDSGNPDKNPHSFNLTVAGLYQFHCSVHSNMNINVTVKASETTKPAETTKPPATITPTTKPTTSPSSSSDTPSVTPKVTDASKNIKESENSNNAMVLSSNIVMLSIISFILYIIV